ncbi:MAG: HAD family phosphatase [Candidatus Hydrogenedentes bacterium]|nr:HAD family phosphatase [Candidatus Hydrogenedentota bacterium]
MKMLPRFADRDTAAGLVSALSDEFAVVENPPYIHPPYEVYPLSKGCSTLSRGLAAAVMDMDGTTTTTEPVCIHALDTMVRRASGRDADPDWPGLDHARDYPHIIGNSTTKHVEYLVRAYGGQFLPDALRRHYIAAAAWTLGHGQDPQRQREVRSTMASLGVGEMAGDARFAALCREDFPGGAEAARLLDTLDGEYAGRFSCGGVAALTRACIDIYYQRYHEVLGAVGAGRGAEMAHAVLGGKGGHLIGPMPGVGVFLALVKGLLGTEAGAFAEMLAVRLDGVPGTNPPAPDKAAERMARLGAHFQQHPAKVALVTSSIAYEARLVLGEVFRVLREEIPEWPVDRPLRADLLEAFASPEVFYDGVITATDSSEIRLKPHRDLYSMAMHELGVYPEDFDCVAGFEDSDSGTIAIRAAGIALSCALPFAMTTGHQFRAATQVCPGGLPQVLLEHGLFLEGF